jgi:uracil-DNA glycosylase
LGHSTLSTCITFRPGQETVAQQRGRLLPCPPLEVLGTRDALSAASPQAEGHLLATIHPSAGLRADDREAAYAGLVEDLKVAAQVL